MLHVMYSCNESYAVQLCTSVFSLLENNRTLEIQVHCVEDKLRAETKNRIQWLACKFHRQITFYALDDVIAKLHLCGQDRHPPTIYSKLCMDFLDAERLLYLDCDTVVNGSLQHLEQMEMGKCLAAGVAMPYNRSVLAQMGLGEGDLYICDGVVLINLQLWKKEQKTEHAASYIHRCAGQPPMLSEGTLNYICRGRIMILEPCYNLMSVMLLFNSRKIRKIYKPEFFYTEQQLMHARKNALIIHYLDEFFQRPWYADSDHPYREVYRAYARRAGCKPVLAKGDGDRRRKYVRYCGMLLPGGMFAWLRMHLGRMRGRRK